MKKTSFFVVLIAACLLADCAYADVSVPMFFTAKQGQGEKAGTIIAKNSPHGLLLIPDLHGLTPGLHGFHVHDNPSCDAHGMAAGGQLDPKKTAEHLGPYGEGHLGDLPPLYVDKSGKVNLPVLAPRLKESDIKGHSLMIHDGGDNYSDKPQILGGGGGRMVCGVVEK